MPTLFQVSDNWSVIKSSFTAQQFKMLGVQLVSFQHKFPPNLFHHNIQLVRRNLPMYMRCLEHVVLRFSGENANNHFLKHVISSLLNLLKTLQDVIHFRLSILSIGLVCDVHQGMRFACVIYLSVNQFFVTILEQNQFSKQFPMFILLGSNPSLVSHSRGGK